MENPRRKNKLGDKMPYKDPEERKAYQKRRVPIVRKMRQETGFYKKRYRENKERKLMANKKYRLSEKGQIQEKNQAKRNWRNLKIRKKLQARNSAYYKIRVKRCEKCGETKNLQRHHPDYSKPLWVVVVCEKCHLKIHGKEKVSGRVLAERIA